MEYQRAAMHVGNDVPDWTPEPGDDFVLFYNTADNEIYYWDGAAWSIRSTGGGGDISAAWPVGSVFTSTVSTNPATLLGFGTWAAFGAGRVLVGFSSGDTDFGTNGATGGEKTHALTIAELPQTASGPARSGTGATLLDGFLGTGTAHNNLQPYVVVYFWQRTA